MRLSERLRLMLNARPASLDARPVSIRTRLRVGATCFAFLLVCVVAGMAPVAAQEPRLGPIARIFVGKIRTMNESDRVAQAVAVDRRGLIVAVGTEKEIFAAAAGIAPAPEVIRLERGQTMLPGFLDAHLHVVSLLLAHSGLAKLVGPCLPGPYDSGNSPGCQNYIGATFGTLKGNLKPADDKAFLFGVNLDPSRQPYNETTTSVVLLK